MLLKDCKLGATIIVYLGVDGNLVKKTSTVGKLFPLRATVVGSCWHSTTGVSHMMLGFSDTVAAVPNKVARDVMPHTTPGYTFLTDFHKQYRWTVWEESDMECVSSITDIVASTTTKQYPFDTCKCGIHLTLHPCEYHPYTP
jgi:hypothetical protein